MVKVIMHLGRSPEYVYLTGRWYAQNKVVYFEVKRNIWFWPTMYVNSDYLVEYHEGCRG
jgi:hypothetical protein